MRVGQTLRVVHITVSGAKLRVAQNPRGCKTESGSESEGCKTESGSKLRVADTGVNLRMAQN